MAAQHGEEAAVWALLDGGADIYESAIDGSTPLHTAAEGGSEEVVRLLLARGRVGRRRGRSRARRRGRLQLWSEVRRCGWSDTI